MNIGDVKLKLILEGDQFDSSVEKSSAKLVTLDDRLANVGLRIQGVSTLFNLLKSTLGTLVDEYSRQEVALAKLENGLNNVGASADSLTKLNSQASGLQEITPFGDEEIINSQAMLTTFQKSAEEIEILTPRILDLAAAYMKSGDSSMDLQQVAVMLGKVNEDTVGQLKRVGVAFDKEQEAKLKSLKGTEQAIYLSQILDQNFKGMAETVGNTTAGQMKKFQNAVGDLKEELGRILVEVLGPILAPIASLVKMLTAAPEPVKVLTLGVIALAAAFTALGTSMGGLPYIIGGIITAMAAMNSMFKLNTDELKKNQQAMLEQQEVSKEMEAVLKELNITVDNMAAAYDALSGSILGMTKVQLESARKFVDAEIAKTEALVETFKANLKLRNLDAEWGMSSQQREEMMGRQFAEYTDIGPNLDKLYSLRDMINSKMKFTEDAVPKSVTGSDSKSFRDNSEKEIDIVEEAIKTWQQAIKIYYSLASTKKLLNDEGKNEIAVLEEINKFTLDNINLTKEQGIKLDDFSQSLIAAIEKEKDFVISGENIIDRIKKIVDEEKRLYEEMQARQPNRKLKPFDELGVTLDAISLEKELLGSKIKVQDLMLLMSFTQEKINNLSKQNYRDTEKILQLEKLRQELRKDIREYYDFEKDILTKNYELKLAFIDNEFLKRKSLVEYNYSKELELFRQNLAAQNLDKDTYDRLYLSRKKMLDEKRTRDLAAIEKEKYVFLLDALSKGTNAASSIAQLLGIGAENFIFKLINGLANAINLVTQIKELLEAIGIIKSITSFIGMATGMGSVAVGLTGGGGIGLPDSVGGVFPGASQRVVQVPYIATVSAKGRDIFVTLQKEKSALMRRTI